MKEIVAREVASRVKSGEVIGVGTGTTVDAAIEAIGERVKAEGMVVSVVPTSYQSAWRCQEHGLTVLAPTYRGMIAWGFDGADQVTANRWAIKGKGGAMLQEKILAKRCKSFTIIVDKSKLVERLGVGQPIPIEVIPEALTNVEFGLRDLGVKGVLLRTGSGKHGPIVTERGNIILDATFDTIEQNLEGRIKSITGVVESGLFIGCISEVLVADDSGVRVL
jgi:ribose 5-phosphate isomerase A